MLDLKVYKKNQNITTLNYAHIGDAGLDLRAAGESVINPSETVVVRTGIKVAIPNGFVGLVWDKSGYAAKNSIHVLAGVIDATYRGEIGVVMINLGKEKFVINQNMKIAQMLVQPIEHVNIIEVDSLEDTTRGEGSFGSTGKH